jgi:collagen triple helix repeat protein
MIGARLRAGLSYANVVGTLALFIALGGVSYAAVKLPAHSVGTKQLKADAVTSANVRDGTLRQRDFQGGALPRGGAEDSGQGGPPGGPGGPGTPGAPGAPGARGDTGAPGAAGATGAAGAAGARGLPGAKGDSGLAGAKGDPGRDGAKGDPGPDGERGSPGRDGLLGVIGPAGAPGPTGVVKTEKISGTIVTTPAAADVWQFLGSQAVVTTTSTQRLTAAAMVPIATTLGPQTIKLDLCYQPNGTGGELSPFGVGNWSFVVVSSIRTSQSVAGTIAPGAGTWRVGACTQTTVALDDNDFVNGYVQVTNQ